MTYSKTMLLPALLAAGSGLATAPASALELGDLKVESTLGQPLRASIAYALAPHENLAPYCISLAPAVSLDAVPTIRNARISLTADRIILAGAAAVREPVIVLPVDIDCPDTPKLLYEFIAFVDPALEVAAPAAAAGHAPAPAQPAAVPVAAPAPAAAPGVRPATAAEYERLPVTDSRYRVERGDSLSVIARRLDRQGVPLWDAVNALFAANPDAFIDEDPNRLKAGAWLVIPDFAQAGIVGVEPATVSTLVPAEVPAETPAVELPAESVPAAPAGLAEPRPGDPVIAGRSAATQRDIAAPAAATAPVAPVTRVTATSPAGQPADRSLWWMIGGGALLLGGLLYLAVRERIGARSKPARDHRDHPQRRARDRMPESLPVLDPIVADDYALEDDSPTSENLVLDADLEVGTGFRARNDIMVAEDFGFDTSADLDLELPDETGQKEDEPGTDVPLPKIESTILESEVLPGDDDYDMSVIMDVTKVPDPKAVTERDLKAVVIGGTDETRTTDAYTISREVDYQVLEQDYEDELTATQALNIKIEKAASDLVARLDAKIRAERDSSRDPASSLANVTAFSSLCARNDDDAGNPEVTASLESVPDFDDDSKTAHLPAADDDEDTIESEQFDNRAR